MKINEYGEIVRDDFQTIEQTEEEKLLSEYQVLERKVLRFSGSTATPEEAVRYEELKKRFADYDKKAGDSFAQAKEAMKKKLVGKTDNSVLSTMLSKYKKENE